MAIPVGLNAPEYEGRAGCTSDLLEKTRSGEQTTETQRSNVLTMFIPHTSVGVFLALIPCKARFITRTSRGGMDKYLRTSNTPLQSASISKYNINISSHSLHREYWIRKYVLELEFVQPRQAHERRGTSPSRSFPFRQKAKGTAHPPEKNKSREFSATASRPANNHLLLPVVARR